MPHDPATECRQSATTRPFPSDVESSRRRGQPLTRAPVREQQSQRRNRGAGSLPLVARSGDDLSYDDACRSPPREQRPRPALRVEEGPRRSRWDALSSFTRVCGSPLRQSRYFREVGLTAIRLVCVPRRPRPSPDRAPSRPWQRTWTARHGCRPRLSDGCRRCGRPTGGESPLPARAPC